MMGSMTPLAEPLACHPVHRATALLRQALYSSPSAAPDPAELWSDPIFPLDPAPVDLAHGPVSITYPDSLALLLGLPAPEGLGTDRQAPVTSAPDGGAANASLEEASEGDELLDRAAQRQLDGLVQAFYRRQRQANLLVACSIATAVVLTFCGLIFLFSMTGPARSDREDAAPQDGTSVTRAARRAELAPPLPPQMRVVVNEAAKAAPLLLRTKAGANPVSFGGAMANTQILNARPEHPLALEPLLPLGTARYVLLRGLPEDAELSAGRRTGTGTWMVKGEEVDGLTLTAGANASGDYPMEAYLLGAEDGPQARRRLVLRVLASPQVYTAGFGPIWPTTVPAPPPEPELAAQPATALPGPIETEALHEQAQRLLGEGDIAAARLLLADLAERGMAEAAYELALTYDREVLAKAGLDGIAADMGIAQGWYARAAQAGHAGAAQRLQMLARSRAGA